MIKGAKLGKLEWKVIIDYKFGHRSDNEIHAKR